MPANRSRTIEWRRCLRQIQERGGVLEVAIAHPEQDPNATLHLVWRVRLLALSETELVIEQPAALGQTMAFQPGIELLAVLAIGQNRWMFTTKNLGPAEPRPGDRAARAVPALRLSMPDSVQRCQRRTDYRVDTTTLSLPDVDMWPLLDPRSVLLAERACEIQIERAFDPESAAPVPSWSEGEGDLMPEVGPCFASTLLNLGGGGVGLRVPARDVQALARHKLFWMRISLPPGLPVPICATAKLVHTHIQSNHDMYAGMAFDFSFNPGHQRCVVDQICRYIAYQQRQQFQHAPPQEQRRSA